MRETSFQITLPFLKTVKAMARQALPDVKSGHLDESIAAGFGYASHSSLLNDLKVTTSLARPFEVTAFRNRLQVLSGVVMQDKAAGALIDRLKFSDVESTPAPVRETSPLSLVEGTSPRSSQTGRTYQQMLSFKTTGRNKGMTNTLDASDFANLKKGTFLRYRMGVMDGGDFGSRYGLPGAIGVIDQVERFKDGVTYTLHFPISGVVWHPSAEDLERDASIDGMEMVSEHHPDAQKMLKRRKFASLMGDILYEGTINDDTGILQVKVDLMEKIIREAKKVDEALAKQVLDLIGTPDYISKDQGSVVELSFDQADSLLRLSGFAERCEYWDSEKVLDFVLGDFDGESIGPTGAAALAEYNSDSFSESDDWRPKLVNMLRNFIRIDDQGNYSIPDDLKEQLRAAQSHSPKF